MKRAPLLLALAATVALLWHSVTPAQACTCVPLQATPELLEQYRGWADVIVVGSGVPPPANADHPNNVYIRVLNVITGTPPQLIPSSDPLSLRSEGPGGGCDYHVSAASNRKHLLALTRQTDETYQANRCASFPTDSAYYSDFFSLLIEESKPAAPTTNPPVSVDNSSAETNAPTVVFAIAAVVLPLAYLLAASFVFPAKGSRM
ncbi:MAG TPA: hypothetical protein VLS25_11405 [Dehalococcoidia bacterium]|nr:hypothetical protein [Dehalococcoidia bacterium]